MKRFFLILCIFIFFVVQKAQADDLYNLDQPPNLNFEYKNTTINSPSSNYVNKKQKNTKQGFFKKFFNKNKKQKPQFDNYESGYKGKLPSIQSEFEYKKPKNNEFQNKNKNAEEFLPEEFQKSKTEDPLFLDVILNKENPSNYIKDMLLVMRFLEAFRNVVETHDSVQRFNANVNVLDLHARRIEKLYKDQPEGMSESFFLLLDLAYKAKVLGNLKFDANYYAQFSPVKGTEYDPIKILDEDNKLLIDLDKTIFAIRQLNN